jgi:hypothetical protein
MKGYINALIFGIAIIVASMFLGKAYVDRVKSDGEIQVTGLGKTDFTSDLIVWEGRFVAENVDLKGAYNKIETDKELVKKYLSEKGVSLDDIVFSAVKSDKKMKQNYSANGNYLGEEFSGYELKQTIQIESDEVSKIENISREITELLNRGVQFYSQPPRYYYTKLSDLKIEMISKATEDARIRAEKIAEYSGGELGDLESAKMGVFQITGQNSNEGFSWGGTFNTSSKAKTASITMKLVYNAK